MSTRITIMNHGAESIMAGDTLIAPGADADIRVSGSVLLSEANAKPAFDQTQENMDRGGEQSGDPG